jgi:hypothetical protein
MLSAPIAGEWFLFVRALLTPFLAKLASHVFSVWIGRSISSENGRVGIPVWHCIIIVCFTIFILASGLLCLGLFVQRVFVTTILRWLRPIVKRFVSQSSHWKIAVVEIYD